MKRLMAAAAVLATIGFLLYRFWLPKPLPETEMTVEKKDLEVTLTTSGKVRAEKEMTASFPIAGSLELVASPGATFRQSEILARLKTNELWANLQKAYADLNKANSNFYYYLELKSETDKTYAWKEDGVSKAKVKQADNNVAIARDGVEVAQFTLDAAKAAYNKAFIKAPFAGVVGQVPVRVGETISIGQTILTFFDPNTFIFEAEVDEVDVSFLKIGQAARVSLDAFPEREFDATIENIDLSAHQSSAGATVYTVRLKLEGGSDLRSGLNGEANILKEKKSGIIVLPNDYIFEEDSHNFVWVKVNGEKQKRSVEIGELFESGYEVSSGLAPGEVVVTTSKQ